MACWRSGSSDEATIERVGVTDKFALEHWKTSPAISTAMMTTKACTNTITLE